MTPTIDVRRVRRVPGRRQRWRVRLLGANGEVLSVTEPLNSVEAVWVNIAAQTQAFTGCQPRVVWDGHPPSD